ncbi:hypothetical protein DSO57_1016913 [Entomophthora muscae]|uniref:Uncharacterized protein n=1 Tax=Entomophthora muscae TaxID=34485 RepID=A0ACC2U379_9FUNG|nr:hypothetical protein DSO57_1016913 [Entomophthora muscae]
MSREFYNVFVSVKYLLNPLSVPSSSSPLSYIIGKPINLAFEAFCNWLRSLVLALICASVGSLISGTLTVLATVSLLSTLKKWASERAKSASTASSVASAINDKVLNALGELQLQLSADLFPSDIPITDAQRSVALLDALNGDVRLWGFKTKNQK